MKHHPSGMRQGRKLEQAGLGPVFSCHPSGEHAAVRRVLPERHPVDVDACEGRGRETRHHPEMGMRRADQD
jgi:hypothetical protein